MNRYGPALALALLAALALPACTPPEARRTRGSEDIGADPRNRSSVVRMHGGSDTYYETPCLTTVKPCTGPLPRFGLEANDDSRR